jgi:DNA anti-recombination protein RmuC
MLTAAVAFKDDYTEVPVSSTEVLEANVTSIRIDLNEFKTDFRAAVARIDSDIKSAVAKLEMEIRSMAAKAESDLRQFADSVEARFSELRAERKEFSDRVDTQFSELRADNKYLREKVDKGFERLHTKIDTEIKETHKALIELSQTVLRIDSRQSSILWVGGGLVVLITLAITVGKASKWF